MVFSLPPSPFLYFVHISHQLLFPSLYCQPCRFHFIPAPLIQLPSSLAPQSLASQPAPSSLALSAALSGTWGKAPNYNPVTWCCTGTFDIDHNWGKVTAPLGQASAALPPILLRLSCSHVVRFLLPSVVFLASACVCTECHEFDLVIA